MAHKFTVIVRGEEIRDVIDAYETVKSKAGMATAMTGGKLLFSITDVEEITA